MAEIDFGYIEGQEKIFGDTGAVTQAGVPIDLWNTWSDQTQDLYQQDYFRTTDQQNYSMNLDPATGLAYAYTGIVDYYTGLEAVEVGQTTNEYIDYTKEALPQALNIAGEGALLLGLGAVALLLGRK